MSIKAKMVLIFISVLIAIILIPLGITRYFLQHDTQEIPDIKDPSPLIIEEFPSEPFTLAEGYTFDLVESWELTNQAPDRNVDRYRFDRSG